MALADVQARFDVTSRIYLDFTVVDPVDGSLSFALSDIGFNVGTTRVYPCVLSWGALRKYMPIEGRTRESGVVIEFEAGAIVVPSTGTTRYRFGDLVREKPLRNVQVTFKQWNGDPSTTPAIIWAGYWSAIESTFDDGIERIGVSIISEANLDMTQMVSDMISETTAGAPQDSFGKMVPIIYGEGLTTHHGKSPVDPENALIYCGYITSLFEGVVVDESQTLLKRKVKFHKADGADPVWEAGDGGATSVVDAFTSFWLYSQTDGTFAALGGASTVETVDNNELSVVVDGEPTVFAYTRPNGNGSRTHSAHEANLYKALNGDPSDFLLTTSTDYEISFLIPSRTPFGPLRVKSVYLLVDVENVSGANRDIEFGLWNVNDTGGAHWLGNSSKRQTVTGITTGTRAFYYTSSANRYLPGDAGAAANVNGIGTFSQFTLGRLVSADANNNEIPLDFFFNVTSASKDGLRLYAVSVIFEAQVLLDRIHRSTVYSGLEAFPQGPRPPSTGEWQRMVDVFRAPRLLGSRSKDMSYVCWINGQQDDGSGTHEGTADVSIRKASAIAHHILSKRFGLTCNATAGTCGNFTDERTEAVADEKWTVAQFGPDPKNIRQAIEEIQRLNPVRIWRENLQFKCAYDAMNPHSSRYYRSASSRVRVSARSHVLSEGFKVDALPDGEIENNIALSYGHMYGSGLPARQFEYQNPYSIDYFGERRKVDVPAPLVSQRVNWTVPEAARFQARYYGRRRARPRLTVACRLSHAFYDLELGHVLEFDDDMEDIGLQCLAYRCGRFDYAYFRTDIAVANQADDSSPSFIPGGSISSTSVWCSHQQNDRIQLFGLPGTGSYTEVNNGWKFYDGSTWTSFSNVVASDAGDPDGVFKRSGDITISWDRPAPNLWPKTELLLAGSTLKGPGYWFGLEYTSSTVAQTGSGGISRFPAEWRGRWFEVTEITRKPGGLGSYPYVDVVLQELM